MAPRRSAAADEYFRPSEAGPPQDYRGVPVTEVGIRVGNLGDGFRESTAIAPMEIPIGAKVMGIFYGTVDSHEHDPTRESDEDNPELKLSHVIKAEGAFFPDPDLLIKVVSTHQERVKQHRAAQEAEKRAAKGEGQLPGTEATRPAEGGNVTPLRGKDAAAGSDPE